MREFFRGWRRKVGCVTVGMACVFAAGWVRSYQSIDVLNSPISTVYLTSVDGAMICNVLAAADGDLFCLPEFSANTISVIEGFFDIGIEWHWRWLGIGSVKTMAGDEEPYLLRLVIPYWLFVLPLTLLSAFLLLTKPRKPTQKPSEPPATIGA